MTSWALFASAFWIQSAASSFLSMVPPSGRDFTAASGRLLAGQERLELSRFFEHRARADVQGADSVGIGPPRAQERFDVGTELVPELARVAAIDHLRPQLARRLVVGLGMLAESVEEHACERVAAAGEIGERVHPLFPLQEQLALVDLRD